MTATVAPSSSHATAKSRALDPLAIQAQAGDMGAAAKLLDGMGAYLRRAAYRLRRRHRLREVDVDDLLQEKRLSVLRALPQFDPARASALTYLGESACLHAKTVARSLATLIRVPEAASREDPHVEAALRRPLDVNARERDDEEQGRRTPPVEVEDKRRGPAEEVERADSVAAAVAGLARLSWREREVISRRCEGVTLKAIAASRGCSREAVRLVEVKALLRMRRAIGEMA